MNFEQSLKVVTQAFPRKPEHIKRLYASAMRESSATPDTWIADMKDRLKASVQADREARALFRDAFGASKYRINNAGSVEVYGLAPNSSTLCWWLYAGSVDRAIERLQ